MLVLRLIHLTYLVITLRIKLTSLIFISLMHPAALLINTHSKNYNCTLTKLKRFLAIYSILFRVSTAKLSAV